MRLPHISLSWRSAIASCLPLSVSKQTKPNPLKQSDGEKRKREGSGQHESTRGEKPDGDRWRWIVGALGAGARLFLPYLERPLNLSVATKADVIWYFSNSFPRSSLLTSQASPPTKALISSSGSPRGGGAASSVTGAASSGAGAGSASAGGASVAVGSSLGGGASIFSFSLSRSLGERWKF